MMVNSFGIDRKKHPYIAFYTGDWLKDPRLSLCSPATRGVWIDLICAMHELDRCGELRGTPEELARTARCSTVELVAALTELQNKQAADVQQRNGSWTVANRRMKKEADTRLKRAEAGSRGGSKRQATREQIPEYENENEGLEKVREFARGEGIGQVDADWFFWKCQGNGWTNGGKPILDWKATLRCWYKAGYCPSQKFGSAMQSRPTFSRNESQMSAFEIEKRCAAISDEISALWKKHSFGSNGTTDVPPAIRAEINALKHRRDQLKKALTS